MVGANTQGAYAHCWVSLLVAGAHQHPPSQPHATSLPLSVPLALGLLWLVLASQLVCDSVQGTPGDLPAPNPHASSSCPLRQHDSPTSCFQSEASILSSSQ